MEVTHRQCFPSSRRFYCALDRIASYRRLLSDETISSWMDYINLCFFFPKLMQQYTGTEVPDVIVYAYHPEAVGFLMV